MDLGIIPPHFFLVLAQSLVHLERPNKRNNEGHALEQVPKNRLFRPVLACFALAWSNNTRERIVEQHACYLIFGFPPRLLVLDQRLPSAVPVALMVVLGLDEAPHARRDPFVIG